MNVMHDPAIATALQIQISRFTGAKNQSEPLKQILRLARGALKSTLSTNRELMEFVLKLSAY